MPTLLDLPPRRHAMLKAMGVDLWWIKAPPATASQPSATESPAPQAQAQPSQAAAQTATTQATTTATKVAAQAAAPVAQAPAATAAPAQDWQITLTPAAPWLRNPPEPRPPAQYLLVVDDFSALGNHPDQEQAHKLLHNMLHAMGWADSPALWISHAQRQPAPAAPATPDAPASIDTLLAQLRPRVVLALGRDAARHVLGGDTRPLGVLRASAHHIGATPVIVSYSPAYLLRASHAKRNAWQDLQRAMQAGA